VSSPLATSKNGTPEPPRGTKGAMSELKDRIVALSARLHTLQQSL
jgi:hypothetical protein